MNGAEWTEKGSPQISQGYAILPPERFLRSVELSPKTPVKAEGYAVPSGTSAGASDSQSRAVKYHWARASGDPGSGSWS